MAQGFGQGVLQGIDMYRNFSQQRRANERNDASLKIAREQQDIANYQQADIEKQDRAKNVVGAIDGHFGAQGFSDYRSKPWAKLVDEAPKLAAQLANSKPGFTKFLNEKGENVQAEVVRFDKQVINGQAVYTPIVKRFDTGEEAPMTEGRSADAKDPVVRLSEEDLKNKMDKLWRGAVQNGGYQNEMSRMVGREAALNEKEELETSRESVATALSEASLAVVENDDSISPQAKTEFADLVSDIDDVEELKKIAAAQGIDVDSIVAKGQAAADAEILATAPEGSLEKLLLENGVTRAKWDGADKETRKRWLERLNSKEDSDQRVNETTGRVGALFEQEAGMRWDGLVNLYNDAKESAAGRFFGLSELTDEPAPTRQSNQVAEKEAEIRRQNSVRTEEDIDSVFTTAPPFEVTTENLQKAIISGTDNPTPAQKEEVQGFLTANNIKTTADFEQKIKENKIALKDAHMVAFVASMSHSGTAAEQDANAQSLMNLIERGSMDTTQYQKAQMDDAAAGRRTAQYNAETTRAQLQQEIREYDQAEVDAGVKASLALFDDILVDAGMAEKGEDGTIVMTDNDFEGDEDTATLMGRKIARYMGTHPMKARGPRSLEAYLAGMKPSVGLYIQSLAAADTNDVFSKENMLDFFRVEPNGTISFDMQQLRVGSVKNGKPQTIAYVGPDGVESQSVSLAEIQRASPLLAKIVVTAAEANSASSK